MSDAWTIDRATAKEIGERLNCTRQSVEKHARKAGITAGHDGKFDAARLIASMEEGRAMDKRHGSWNQEETAGLLEWKTRLEEQKTRALERKNDIEEGKLAWVADVEAARRKVNQSVKTDILSACDSVAPRLQGKSVSAMGATLKAAMMDALRHIAEDFKDEDSGRP